MRIKYENPKLLKSEIAKHLGYSSSTLQRYRNDVNMLSPYRILPNNTKKRTKKASNNNFNDNSRREFELKGPQKTPNDFVKPNANTKSNKRNKNISNAGSLLENNEINDQ